MGPYNMLHRIAARTPVKTPITTISVNVKTLIAILLVNNAYLSVQIDRKYVHFPLGLIRSKLLLYTTPYLICRATLPIKSSSMPSFHVEGDQLVTLTSFSEAPPDLLKDHQIKASPTAIIGNDSTCPIVSPQFPK